MFLIRSDHNSLVWLTCLKHVDDQLARFLEELLQCNFKLIHRKGAEHVNVDALSRIKDPLEECHCYGAGQRLGDLPCRGCHYCTRAHKQWAQFNDDVYDVVPFAIRSVETMLPDQAMLEHWVVSNWVKICAPLISEGLKLMIHVKGL